MLIVLYMKHWRYNPSYSWVTKKVKMYFQKKKKKIHFIHQYWVIMWSARFIGTIVTFLRQKKKLWCFVLPIHWTEICHRKEKQLIFSLSEQPDLTKSSSYASIMKKPLHRSWCLDLCAVLAVLVPKLHSCSHYLRKKLTVRRCCQISIFTLSPRTRKYTQAVINYFHVAENGTRNTVLDFLYMFILKSAAIWHYGQSSSQ